MPYARRITRRRVVRNNRPSNSIRRVSYRRALPVRRPVRRTAFRRRR